MSLDTTAPSELYVLLIPEISTKGIHRSNVDFLHHSPDYKANILSSSNISPEQGCSSRSQPDQSVSQFKLRFHDFSKRRGFVLYIKYSVAGYYLLGTVRQSSEVFSVFCPVPFIECRRWWLSSLKCWNMESLVMSCTIVFLLCSLVGRGKVL